ncbi:MAG: hypothetical protein CMC18_08225 [Flavobacteriaceae bacterium]|nr:hypothetical protein [Flavobacteriaceae bacterium]
MLQGQQLSSKNIAVDLQKKLNVDLTYVAHFEVDTHQENYIQTELAAEGEYRDMYNLSILESEDIYDISLSKNPLYSNFNDKLSAHKVLAITLKILVPSQMVLDIDGLNSIVYTKGNYRELNVFLNEGICFLHHNSIKSKIITAKADVYLEMSTIPELIFFQSAFANAPINETLEIDALWVVKSRAGNIYRSNR